MEKKSEHDERNKGQKDGKEQSHGFYFHAARADLCRVGHGKSGFDKFALVLPIVPDTDIFGFRFAEFFARAVFVHVRLPIKFFDIGVSVGDQNLFFGRCDERADILQIRVRKSRAALDADQVRADKGHVFARLFRRDLVLFHVGDHFPVFEFDDAVGVRFSEFPIVRNDEDEFIFGKFFPYRKPAAPLPNRARPSVRPP